MTVQKLMWYLENRGDMFICPYNYDTLIAYIFGYEASCSTNGTDNPFEGMKELVHCCFGKSTCLVWPAVIQRFLAKDDEEAISLVFSLFRNLDELKKEKGIDWLKAEFDRLERFKKKRKTNLNWPNKNKHNKAVEAMPTNARL